MPIPDGRRILKPGSGRTYCHQSYHRRLGKLYITYANGYNAIIALAILTRVPALKDILTAQNTVNILILVFVFGVMIVGIYYGRKGALD